MITQSIFKMLDVDNHRHRTIIYTTLEDPVTRKKFIEIEKYFYDETGKIEPTDAKGSHIDSKV